MSGKSIGPTPARPYYIDRYGNVANADGDPYRFTDEPSMEAIKDALNEAFAFGQGSALRSSAQDLECVVRKYVLQIEEQFGPQPKWGTGICGRVREACDRVRHALGLHTGEWRTPQEIATQEQNRQ